jgi:HD-like signal output (HDOD) protein
MDAVDALETLGLERARNLAITFFALNYENPKSVAFDWTPLWRHQVSVGVVQDFIYDALDLKRCGLEYATGTFHDIGKMILAELFPFAYFTVLNRAFQEEISLKLCETSLFGIDHAELAVLWLRDEELPPALADAIALHETPEKIHRRAVLAQAVVCANHLVKQIGIGFSGNPLLDARPWEELPATVILWEARGNKEYPFEDFTRDILGQFGQFPDLI